MFERYNESARRVLFFSRDEVTELGGASIETEHLLLGLLRENKGLLSRLLAPLPSQKIRSQIASRSHGQKRIAPSVEIPFSAETKRVLNFAAEEADRLLSRQIGSEHLMLALLREEKSLAAAILNEHGVRLDELRLKVLQRPGETESGGRLSAQIDQIKNLVQLLSRTPPDSAEARELVEGIEDALEALREHLGE